ncbi:dihydrolipoyllysine-residue (2-methylpropanoyl)transferase [Kangiella profundi]|uniref:Dihydrolipoamide acetyltransferase component of pyruvate dehydrogenase complex n=1 Tax=Kangiella profundi TaxID=1561924 RepID=A0A2K9AYR1_9GAMM|nr:2-oxo acid dehydrogenase subunit E2 [Kangiella profundi]AUD79009.1 dihydrolipoyllysine-residue (2-methylpropanoyl)transferase [Kangiella profundi]GGF02265.1 dihydrolipoamide acetyltransferase component of pyruvate dehydrogenase complex [Kangiella profundi]
MKQFNLPDLGEGLPDAEIVRWLVKEGDEVTVDQPMVEMETAKAVVEVPSPFAGRISKLHGKEGDVIDVGAVLVTFGEVGEVAEEAPEPAPVTETTNDETPSQASAPAAGSDTFLLPDLGEGLPDAEIVRWLVKEGDTVTVDQPMVEMETAKAVVEVPSPFAGKVSKLYGQAGDVIEVGAPLVEFGGTGGSSSGESKAAAPAKEEAGEEKRADSGTVVGAVEVGNHVVAETANAVVKALAKKLKVDLTKVKGSGKDGAITQKDVREAAKSGATASTTTAELPQQTAGVDTSNPLAYKASPAVRALARKLGVDLGDCNPTGRKGSITRDDVEQASKGGSSAPRQSQPAMSAQQAKGLPAVSVEVQPEKVRGVRRAMAMGMANSHATVVPTSLVEDADITAWPKGTDSLARYVRAIVTAAKQVPAMNAWFDGENFERLLHPNVNVGIAVDSPDGLYVPVVHNADRMDMAGVRARVQELREKIETKSLKQDDQQNATITLSNFGSIAGRYGTPVVSPPQVAILGTGRFRNELKLTDKGITNAKMLPLSLTFDHRACTGGEAARFLAAVIEDLQLAR